MEINKRLNYILVCLYFVSCVLHSQVNRNVIDTMADNFQKLTDNQSLDNIYLQTSKDIYETEDDLWSKAYILDAEHLIPSQKSKTLYVQLINKETQQAVWEEKYEIENGFVDGHIYIQNSLKTGQYVLVAYSEHSYFENQKALYALKKVHIVKNIKEYIKATSIKNDTISQFSLFPEGGYLVSGLENKLAFKAINNEGLPVEFSGTLYENSLPIFNIKSAHAGMGSLNFTPKKANTYYIKLSESDKKYQLPKIKTTGKTLGLTESTRDFLTFKISQSKNQKPETIYLRLQIRGVIYSIASAKLNEEIIVKMPLEDVPQGIAEATLFNSDLKPIAERLVYVKQDQKLNIKTILDKSEYETREKVTLKIITTNENGEPVMAHLGLSVYDKVYQNKFEPKNILTHYQLSTQLYGNIYNPIYYFNEDNKNRYEALNLLLLTQGWRRYVWNEDNLKENKKLRKKILSDTIIGKVRLAKIKKQPEIQGQQLVAYFAPESPKEQDTFETDSMGVFTINYKHLKATEKGYFYLKPLTPKKPKYVIDITDTSFNIIDKNNEAVTTNYPFPKLIEEKFEYVRPPLIVSDDVNKLDEVVVSAKKKQVFRDKFLSSLANSLPSPDYVCGYGLLNCVNCISNNQRFKIRKPIDGETYIAEDRRSKIIYRKNNNLNYTEEEVLEKFNLKIIKGYYGKREFYQPIYNNETINDPFPDYRNTVFWKPDIITNAKGVARIEFYCSDINTIFTGTIEGIGGTGLLGAEGFNFKVYKREIK
ncbi:hypothetical protein H7U19_06130 [Hyunsoonleella sp. SJ7]|uniref:MG2 domain-containing protein n=1 Tax=Hyunsoonleella aquatilis TaxID=2762758 RepID=A0A923KKM0_9FLAO|nr:hypothetical protein [Hyunsoonleella aquatilis]MBC3757973.1 hypothetical protein [Hyunsoonleella aquatilis]